MAKRFGWLRERAVATTEKRLAAVTEYRQLRSFLTKGECKVEIARRAGITEIGASSVMAWCERYGFDWCENYLRDYLEREGGEE